MTFKALRKALHHATPIRWTRSGIVERAAKEPNGAVRITNFITGRSYVLPHSYAEVNVEVIGYSETVRLGSLLPKYHLRDDPPKAAR